MNVNFYCIKLIDRIIWSMFIIWLGIDSITGYFLNNGNEIPISQLFKFILITVLVVRLSHIKKFVYAISLFLIYLAIFLLNLILLNEVIGISILLLSKFLTTILIFVYVCNFKSEYDSTIYRYFINLTFRSGFLLILVNILIGALGYGFYTYELLQFGYKGFFYAGNELGSTIVPIFGYILYKEYNKNHLLPYIARCVFLIILGISIGTKACIIAPILLAFIIPFIYSNNMGRIKQIICLIILILLSVILLGSYLEDTGIAQIEKIVTNYQEKGFEETITSRRTEYWEQEKNDILHSNIISIFLGLGGNRTVEMDPMDIFLNFGFIGLFSIYSIIFLQLRYVYKTIGCNSWNKLVLTVDLILLCMSCVAGHVIFSSMAGLYFALINSLAFLPKRK